MPPENTNPAPSAQPGAYKIDASSNGNGTKIELLKKLLPDQGVGGGTNNASTTSGAAGTNSGNAFTQLFGKSQTTPNTLSGAQPVSGLPSKSASGPSLSQLLGPKPVLTARIKQELSDQHTRFARISFFLSVLIALGLYVFFEGQLNPEMTFLSDLTGRQTLSQRFEASSKEMAATKTDINLLRFNMARLVLDDINIQIDPFRRYSQILESSTASQSEKQKAEVEHQILGAKIKQSLTAVQEILKKPLGAALFSRRPITAQENEVKFEQLLKERIAVETTKLSSDPESSKNQLRTLSGISRLVEDKEFRQLVLSHDFSKISEKDFSEVLTAIRGKATDELSAVGNIRDKKIYWSSVIQNIHDVTSIAAL